MNLAHKLSPAFTIETYHDEYCEAVGKLIVGIQNGEFGIPITYDDQPDLKEIPHFYQKNKSNFWIALDRGALIGTIALIDVGNHNCLLRKMFVHKDYRGAEKAVGQALLDTLLAWCHEKDIHHIYLGTTDKFQAAQRFYEKNGFQNVAESELPEIDPRIRMKVDNRYYCRTLEPAQ